MRGKEIAIASVVPAASTGATLSTATSQTVGTVSDTSPTQKTTTNKKPVETLTLDFKIHQVQNVTGCGCNIIREGNYCLDKRKILQLEKEKWLLFDIDGSEKIIVSTRKKLLEKKEFVNTYILGKFSNGSVLAAINGIEGLYYIPFSQINDEGIVSSWYIGKLLERIRKNNEKQEVD